MKKYLLNTIAACSIMLSSFAQTSIPAVDKSPMDMSYYPSNFPVQKISDKVKDGPIARIVYSRPQTSGRSIFGELVKFGEVWRMGANEATEIEFFKDVKLGTQKINKGRYTIYALVSENNWDIIINKETDTWGSFKYNSKKDVARFNVPVQKTDAPVESLSMYFDKSTSGFNLVVAWDNVKTVIPFTL